MDFDYDDWTDILCDDYEDLTGNGAWHNYTASDTPLPHQGWKIHLSSEMDEGKGVLETVLDSLQDKGVRHKVRDPTNLN